MTRENSIVQNLDPIKFNLLQVAALEAAANSIVITDAEGKIIWANPAFTVLTGYQLEEALGQNPRFLKSEFHPQEFYQELWEDIIAYKIWHGEMVNRKKDGTLYTEEMTITPVHFKLDSSLYFIAVKQDVTLRRQAEDDLRRTEEQFRALSDFATEWIFWRDAEGKLLYISPACEVITGYTPEEFYKLPSLMEDILYPEDREMWDKTKDKQHKEKRMNLQSALPLEFRIIKKGGMVRWISYIFTSIKDEAGEHRGIRGSITDITEQREIDEKMRLTSKVFENTSEGVLVTDPKGLIVFINQAFQHITGYDEKDVLGQNPRILSSGRHDPEFYRQMWKSLIDKGEWQGEIWNRRKSGEIYPEWLTLSAIKDSAGKVLQYAAIISDLTFRKMNEERIKHLAYHDALTGLPNRYLFLDRLSYALTQSRRRKKLAVIFLDLDRFKDVNDTLGHAAGDLLLREVGERLRSCLREEDTVARMGGDEFTIFLPEIEQVQDAEVVAQKILRLFEYPFQLEGEDIFMSSSLGIAVAPDDGKDAETLLRHSDMAMYQAKENGKNTYGLYHSEMSVQAQDRLNLEQRLRKALEREEFVLFYQPQADIYTGRLIGMEALIRWHHPEVGIVSPLRFIPIAEETGLIHPIGEWVLRTACEQNLSWQKQGLPFLRMAVNLSARQLQQDNLVERIAEILNKTGMDPCWLELEITETVAMQNVTLTSRVLEQLKEMGIHIAIDDFGTGYSSLNYLKRFPIDTLKVDQSFIRDILKNPEDAAIVSTILRLAHNLNYHSIAEGVETEEQLEFLKEHECGGLQGYLISRPLPAKDMTILLRLAQERKNTLGPMGR